MTLIKIPTNNELPRLLAAGYQLISLFYNERSKLRGINPKEIKALAMLVLSQVKLLRALVRQNVYLLSNIVGPLHL